MSNITYKSIGIIHSTFKEPKNVPIQAVVSKGTKGTIEVNSEYTKGLVDLEGFSHIILLYHFNLVKGYSLMVKPFLDQNSHGVFATRAPSRPNPIGLSIVRLKKIQNNILHIEDLDIVDNTPLIDIKPYIPQIDNRKTRKIGWFSKKLSNLPTTKDDGRFCK
jgi:tRNA (adenine37-N6)-methyltransferase